MPADRADPASGAETVEVARTRMLAAVAPLATELIGTEAAAGRTLAATLQAARAQPPFRSSAMDGYGVRAADLALGRFTVLGEALAGRGYAGGPLGAGECRDDHPGPRPSHQIAAGWTLFAADQVEEIVAHLEDHTRRVGELPESRNHRFRRAGHDRGPDHRQLRRGQDDL